MWEKLLASLLNEHRNKTIGVLLGLVASILFITIGFWKVLFIIVFIGIGFFIGKRLDDNKSLDNWLDNIFKK
ncbi:MAG: DUF2273 domain-containing protein [Syntrophomonadaceae bacterium]|jgi:uncharacterized membrane protein